MFSTTLRNLYGMIVSVVVGNGATGGPNMNSQLDTGYLSNCQLFVKFPHFSTFFHMEKKTKSCEINRKCMEYSALAFLFAPSCEFGVNSCILKYKPKHGSFLSHLPCERVIYQKNETFWHVFSQVNRIHSK